MLGIEEKRKRTLSAKAAKAAEAETAAAEAVPRKLQKVAKKITKVASKAVKAVSTTLAKVSSRSSSAGDSVKDVTSIRSKSPEPDVQVIEPLKTLAPQILKPKTITSRKATVCTEEEDDARLADVNVVILDGKAEAPEEELGMSVNTSLIILTDKIR